MHFFFFFLNRKLHTKNEDEHLMESMLLIDLAYNIYINNSFNTLSGGKSYLVVPGVAVPPWANETVITLVCSWWGQGVVCAFTNCMIKKYIYIMCVCVCIYIYIYIYIYIKCVCVCIYSYLNKLSMVKNLLIARKTCRPREGVGMFII